MEGRGNESDIGVLAGTEGEAWRFDQINGQDVDADEFSGQKRTCKRWHKRVLQSALVRLSCAVPSWFPAAHCVFGGLAHFDRALTFKPDQDQLTAISSGTAFDPSPRLTENLDRTLGGEPGLEHRWAFCFDWRGASFMQDVVRQQDISEGNFV